MWTEFATCCQDLVLRFGKLSEGGARFWHRIHKCFVATELNTENWHIGQVSTDASRSVCLLRNGIGKHLFWARKDSLWVSPPGHLSPSVLSTEPGSLSIWDLVSSTEFCVCESQTWCYVTSTWQLPFYMNRSQISSLPLKRFGLFLALGYWIRRRGAHLDVCFSEQARRGSCWVYITMILLGQRVWRCSYLGDDAKRFSKETYQICLSSNGEGGISVCHILADTWHCWSFERSRPFSGTVTLPPYFSSRFPDDGRNCTSQSVRTSLPLSSWLWMWHFEFLLWPPH